MKYHLRKQYGASFRASGSPVHFSPPGMDIWKLGRIYRTAGSCPTRHPFSKELTREWAAACIKSAQNSLDKLFGTKKFRAIIRKHWNRRPESGRPFPSLIPGDAFNNRKALTSLIFADGQQVLPQPTDLGYYHWKLGKTMSNNSINYKVSGERDVGDAPVINRPSSNSPNFVILTWGRSYALRGWSLFVRRAGFTGAPSETIIIELSTAFNFPGARGIPPK